MSRLAETFLRLRNGALPPEGGSHTILTELPEGGSHTILTELPEGGSHTILTELPEGGSHTILTELPESGSHAMTEPRRSRTSPEEVLERTDSWLPPSGGRKRGGLVTYVTAGDPDPHTSAEILVALDQAGADVLEVGVPFSDPVADGPVIQRAAERALRSGMTLRGTLDVIHRVRSRVHAPIVLFTYANPVLRMDCALFAATARDAGVDGVLILDLPLEEADVLRGPLLDAQIDPIFLISPTTSDERIRRAAELGSGFLYVISRLGVTGARDRIAEDIEALVSRVRRNARLPIAVGFGISRPDHVLAACRHADAAVVGSALVNVIASTERRAVVRAVSDHVQWLRSGL